jgi:hypothetical protein
MEGNIVGRDTWRRKSRQAAEEGSASGAGARVGIVHKVNNHGKGAEEGNRLRGRVFGYVRAEREERIRWGVSRPLAVLRALNCSQIAHCGKEIKMNGVST